MKWLEIIEFSSAGRKPKFIERDFQSLIVEIDKERDEKAIKVYSRVAEETDFSIHLHHDSIIIENSGSQLGLNLKSTLKKFGDVIHTIWIE